MIDTFIAGAALALAFFWMLKYGHIVVAVGLVLAAVIGVWGVFTGSLPAPSASTVGTGIFVVGLITVFTVM